MEKKITKIEPMMHNHLKLEFEDGTTAIAIRGQHMQRGADGATHEADPKVGDMWQAQ